MPQGSAKVFTKSVAIVVTIKSEVQVPCEQFHEEASLGYQYIVSEVVDTTSTVAEASSFRYYFDLFINFKTASMATDSFAVDYLIRYPSLQFMGSRSLCISF